MYYTEYIMLINNAIFMVDLLTKCCPFFGFGLQILFYHSIQFGRFSILTFFVKANRRDLLYKRNDLSLPTQILQNTGCLLNVRPKELFPGLF